MEDDFKSLLADLDKKAFSFFSSLESKVKGARSQMYSAGSSTGDLNAVYNAYKKGSFIPLIKRAYNKFIGRKIVNKLWWK